MKLLIVESPTKAKTLTKYLKGFKVIASNGHIIDLPENDIGIDIENNFSPKYVVIKGKEKIIQDIKKEAEKADEIYLGADPDREGEAIAYHIASLIKDKEPRRVLFHEITKNGVLKAIENYTKLNENLFNAQQARRILDRLVGYKLSPFLWKSVKKGLSAGRVQSVALKLIVEREREIRAFVPEEYWSGEALFKSGKKSILAELDKVDGKKIKISNQDEAEKIKKRIESATQFKISAIEKKKKSESPLPPFNTSTLQQEASKAFHYTTEKIMKIAQALYEGKEIGAEGATGLITYMRTDSFRISEEAQASLRNYIKSSFGEKYLSPKTRAFSNNKGKTQDAHEAIRPTDITLTPEKVAPYLSKEELNIYSLIWKRFCATQMSEAEFAQTVITISDSSDSILFRKSGSVMVFDGYRMIYAKNSSDEILPDFKENELVDMSELKMIQHFTKPPARYSEGSLVKELEENGVGRPSTYATIIKHIAERKYIERLKEPKGALGATELGELVADTLQKFFPEIINVDFTAGMENSLDKIEEGEEIWTELLNQFYGKLKEKLSSSLVELKEEGKSRIYADEPCPKCGAKLIMRWSKKGNQPFLSCEKFPECDFSSSFEKVDGLIKIKAAEEIVPETTDEICPNCGAPVVVKNGRFGKFKACSAYPKCKTIIKEDELSGVCPKCKEGTISKKRSKKGNFFYGCSNYPTCDFVSWYPPVAGEKCSECGAEYIIEKKSGKECQMCGKKIG